MVNPAVGRPHSVTLITRQEEAAMHVGQQVFDLATAIHTRIGVKCQDTARTDLRPRVVRQLKSATGHDLTVGGADPARQAITAGLVDELQLFLIPFVIGGASKRSPTVSVRI
jgi:riboflavin biosynthesis pyrimidine reductase